MGPSDVILRWYKPLADGLTVINMLVCGGTLRFCVIRIDAASNSTHCSSRLSRGTTVA